MTTVVDVLVPVAVDTAYSYRAPPALTLAPGDFVACRSGRGMAIGVVWALREGGGDNLKSIAAAPRLAAASAPLARFHRLGRALDAQPRAAWCCAWRSRAPERAEPPAPQIRLRRDRQAAGPHD